MHGQPVVFHGFGTGENFEAGAKFLGEAAKRELGLGGDHFGERGGCIGADGTYGDGCFALVPPILIILAQPTAERPTFVSGFGKVGQ